MAEKKALMGNIFSNENQIPRHIWGFFSTLGNFTQMILNIYQLCDITFQIILDISKYIKGKLCLSVRASEIPLTLHRYIINFWNQDDRGMQPVFEQPQLGIVSG